MSQGTAFTFGAWVALLGGIWFLFEKSESVASRDTKLRITRWLKSLDGNERAPTWPGTFVRMFDHLFGDRHLTWMCFRRSCTASCCAVLIVAMMWVALRPEDIQWWREQLERLARGEKPGVWDRELYGARVYAFEALCLLVVNLLADYVSLLETRYVLGWMVRKDSRRWVVGLLALDVLATAVIAQAGVIIAEVTAYRMFKYGTLEDAIYQGAFRGLLWWLAPVDMPEMFKWVEFMPLIVLIAASFLTSVWVWLYVAAGSIARVGSYVGLGVGRMRSLLDVEAKPITSIGWIAMLLASILYWGVAIARQ